MENRKLIPTSAGPLIRLNEYTNLDEKGLVRFYLPDTPTQEAFQEALQDTLELPEEVARQIVTACVQCTTGMRQEAFDRLISDTETAYLLWDLVRRGKVEVGIDAGGDFCFSAQ